MASDFRKSHRGSRSGFGFPEVLLRLPKWLRVSVSLVETPKWLRISISFVKVLGVLRVSVCLVKAPQVVSGVRKSCQGSRSDFGCP